MGFLSYFIAGCVVFYTLLIILIGVVTYRRQPQFHNNRTLLALIALVLLTLTTLFLIVAQTRSFIPIKGNYFSLFTAIFLLTTAIHQLTFLYQSHKGRGWLIFKVSLVFCAVALAIVTVVIYVYSL